MPGRGGGNPRPLNPNGVGQEDKLNRTEMLLLKVMEECDEVSQRCSKALRFGLDEVQRGQELNNFERIREEVTDLWAALWLLGITPLYEALNQRHERIEKYLQLSQERGALSDASEQEPETQQDGPEENETNEALSASVAQGLQSVPEWSDDEG